MKISKKTIIIIAAVIAALGIGATLFALFGLPALRDGNDAPETTEPPIIYAVRVGDAYLGAEEWAYYFFKAYIAEMAAQPGDLNATESPFGQWKEDENQPWELVLQRVTNEAIQRTLTLYQEAVKANVTLPREEVDQALEAVKYQAMAAGMDLPEYLNETYGEGIDEEVLRRLMERECLAAAYAEQLGDGLAEWLANAREEYPFMIGETEASAAMALAREMCDSYIGRMLAQLYAQETNTDIIEE